MSRPNPYRPQQTGTSCCGAISFHGFSYKPNDKQPLDLVFDKEPDAKTYAKLFEEAVTPFMKADPEDSRFAERNRSYSIIVILNENQVKYGWLPHLKRLGFRLVNSQCNINSGRMCYMFVWSRNHEKPPILEEWESL